MSSKKHKECRPLSKDEELRLEKHLLELFKAQCGKIKAGGNV